MSDHPIDPFLAAWSAVSGVDGFASRLRVYQALRLPGAWDRQRLQSVLSAMLAPMPELSQLFEETFNAWFGSDELDRRLRDLDVREALELLAERARIEPVPPPTPPPPPLPPPTRRRKPPWWLVHALAALLVVVSLMQHHPTPVGEGPGIEPPSEGAARTGESQAQPPRAPHDASAYRLTVGGQAEPEPAWNWRLLAMSGLLLLFIAAVEFWQHSRRRRFRTPPIDPFEIQTSLELQYPEGPRPLPFAAFQLDRLAFRTGLALDYDAVRLNVRDTVRRAAHQAGLVTAMYDPRKQTRGVSLVLPTQLEEVAAVAVEAFAEGMRRRGVPVHATSGAPRWDTEDLILVAVDARSQLDPPIERWLTMPHVALVEVRDPALWAAEVSTLPRRAHPLDAEGLYMALEGAASGRSPLPVVRTAFVRTFDRLEVGELGDAWPLAAACSIISPCDLGTADQLRRELLSSIPFLAFQRVRRLRGVTPDARGWRFTAGLSRELQTNAGVEFTSQILGWQAQRLAAIDCPIGSRAEATLRRERALVRLKLELLAIQADASGRDERGLLEPLRELERLGGDESLKRRVQERLMALPSSWMKSPRLPAMIPWRIFRLSQSDEQRPPGRDPATRPRTFWLFDALLALVAMVLVVLAVPPTREEALIIDGLAPESQIAGLWLFEPTLGTSESVALSRTELPKVGESFVMPQSALSAPEKKLTLVALFETAVPAIVSVAWQPGQRRHLQLRETPTLERERSWSCLLPANLPQGVLATLVSLPPDSRFDGAAARILVERIAGCVVREEQASLPESRDRVLSHRADGTMTTGDVIGELPGLGYPAPKASTEPIEPVPEEPAVGTGPAPVAARVASTAKTPNPCIDSYHCRLEGRCTWQQGVCRATRNSDCKASYACMGSGKCSVRAGSCAVLSSEDCSSPCQRDGLCVADNGSCVAGDVKHCSASASCKLSGYCLFADGVCRVTSEACRESEGCKRSGNCTVRDARCAPGSEPNCAESLDCKVDGLCGLLATPGIAPRCAATEDAHCRASQACADRGECFAEDGRCTVKLDKDCEHTPLCATLGDCAAVGGSCAPAGEEHCSGSSYCESFGTCGFANGQCIATDAGCRQASFACQWSGYCVASGDKCVAGGDSCRAASICESEGKCTALRGECIASSTADCQKSKDCAAAGRCTLGKGECVAINTKRCQDSSECKRSGRCVAVGGECKARTDQQCLASDACRYEGTCTARAGRCVATSDDTCKNSSACASEGRCWAREGECRPISNSDCATSAACGDAGYCALVGERCGATEDVQCRRSKACDWDGSCVAEGGKCQPTTETMCRTSKQCRNSGWCTRQQSVCRPGSDGDCRRSRGCASDGDCHLKNNFCYPTSDADCEASEACRTRQACKLDGNRCIEAKALTSN